MWSQKTFIFIFISHYNKYGFFFQINLWLKRYFHDKRNFTKKIVVANIVAISARAIVLSHKKGLDQRAKLYHKIYNLL